MWGDARKRRKNIDQPPRIALTSAQHYAQGKAWVQPGAIMYPPEVLSSKRVDLERRILHMIGEFEDDTGLRVTKVEVQSHPDVKSGVLKSDRVMVTAQVR